MDFDGRIESKALELKLDRITDRFPAAMSRLLNDLVSRHQADMTRRVSNVALKRRTGALARSLRRTPSTPEKLVAMSHVGRGAPYAATHEFGATIRPRKRKFLTVPLSAARTPAGVTRQQARLVRRGRGWETASRVPGAADSSTFIYGKGDRKFIAVERQGGGVLPLYVLKKSVRIPERLGFRDSWRGRVREFDRTAASRLRKLMEAR